MPQDLPGFYFDEEKNRYFPIKGPIPGSKPNNTSTRNRLLSASKLKDKDDSRIRVGKRISSAKLLQERELDGKWLSFNKWKRSFQHEYQKLQISHSTVWKYQGTECFSLTALEQFCVDIQTLEGASGGSVYALNLREPLDMNQVFHRLDSRTSKIASFTNTVWSADCHPNGTHVAVGMDSGAALVCLESGAVSYVCLSKSDVFSQQFDSSGNVLLCGFRNGAIVPVDVRQKPESVNLATELPKHKIPFSTIRNSNTSDRHGQVFPRKSFQVKAKLMSPGVIFMPSSVCSLVSLYSYDQYFLASSMDGTIKLYDHRMCHRGAVQSYEGHINTHSHLRMGVDPTESFFMSGGEDGVLRLWSIKTGELLFESEIPYTVMSTVCWTGTGRCEKRTEGIESLFEEHLHSQPHNLAAWLGSCKGLYYLCGS
ncbi:uncharacterized protein [Aristolochia californica]|uniref:uncharacterized protein isoform X2 n=1 Tax=Aristolochia californica TaxID=171875 RepID=UPI0035E2C0BF